MVITINSCNDNSNWPLYNKMSDMSIESQSKLWDRLCKDFAHLNDNNYKAKLLFNYIIKLK